MFAAEIDLAMSLVSDEISVIPFRLFTTSEAAMPAALAPTARAMVVEKTAVKRMLGGEEEIFLKLGGGAVSE